MTEAELKRLDRAASHRRGPRTRTENLNRVLDNAAGGITRSPGRCTGCGRPLGAAHAPDCRFAGLT